MASTPAQSNLHQDCLDKLNRVLDLALKSAETASAEGNHKVVIQAAREVTRIVTLIQKMTLADDPKPKPKPRSAPDSLANALARESEAARAFRVQGVDPLLDPGGLDGLSLGLLENISRNWAGLTSLQAEAAQSLGETTAGPSSGNPPVTSSRLQKLFNRKSRKAKGKR